MDRRRRALFFGYGYVAASLTRLLRAQDWTIIGTNRNGAQADGAALVAFTGEPSLALTETVLHVDAIVCSIPPHADGCPAALAFGAALGSSPAWKAYLSTTGVYGDRQGRWAFEDDRLTPESPEAQRRAIAEAQWRAFGGHVFRLPGIYGPGRSPFERVGERRIDKPGQVFSRAHRDDIARALLASIGRPNPGRIYNICDDEPAATPIVTAHAAALLGVTPGPLVLYEDADLSPAARRFYSECKRVSNARAKAELGWRPRYRTYREGLAAILAEMATR
jgi:nucleoside-diphosphate-sugar epimerase